MNSMKKEVMEYINNNFEVSQFELVDYPIFPGGVVLNDINNDSILLYWDIHKQKVIFKTLYKNN